jgi:glycosyltransferase involved in cell wall biosynthesis
MSSSFVRPIRGLWDNSANKFFDSMAAGRPIAINYGGWQADLINANGSGLVLDPYDIDEAAATVVKHVRDDGWLTRAREAAHRLAVEEFSRDVLFSRFEAVLDEAMRTGGRRRRTPGREAVAEAQ